MELAHHGLVLLQRLNAQREFGFLCDCTVVIGDVFFKAHKAVLAAFSNYFRMLFIHQDRYFGSLGGETALSVQLADALCTACLVTVHQRKLKGMAVLTCNAKLRH